MSILRRGGLVSTLAGLIGVSTVLGAGLASKQSPPPQQSSVLVGSQWLEYDRPRQHRRAR